MPGSHNLLGSCTNASLGPPSLPKSAILTQKPSKFANRFLPALTPSDHRLINTANLLHPCMLVRQLPCMIPFTRFGSLLQWYMSYPRTATRYTPVMVLSTTAQDNTCLNAVSNLLTLFQMPQQPYCRLLPDLVLLCHSMHQPNLYNLHKSHLLHLQHQQPSKPQTTAVPTKPAVPKVIPTPTPATPSVAPCSPKDQVMLM